MGGPTAERFAQAERGKFTNLTRLQDAVAASGLDAVIASSPENVPYMSGFYNFDLRLIPGRFHVVVWPVDGEPAFVASERRTKGLGPADTFINDLRGYGGEGEAAMEVVAEILRDRHLTDARIGFEGPHFPAGNLDQLRRAFPKIEFVDCFELLEDVRMVKTPAEIEMLRFASHATSRAIGDAYRAAKPGDSEKSIIDRMSLLVQEYGADIVAFNVFGSGPKSAGGHVLADEHPVVAGDVMRCDFGGLFQGYYSDLARTAVVGQPDERQQSIYQRLVEIEHAMIDAIRPGIPVSHLYDVGKAAYERLDLPFRWGILGHGIGLGIHEHPQFFPWDSREIEPGMVFAVEPGYSEAGVDGYHVEDFVVVTETGAEWLTDPADGNALYIIE
jgi:Xaa-Pro aminopeptidase